MSLDKEYGWRKTTEMYLQQESNFWPKFEFLSSHYLALTNGKLSWTTKNCWKFGKNEVFKTKTAFPYIYDSKPSGIEALKVIGLHPIRG